MASHVRMWLEEGPAVVGLNEIHPSIGKKLQSVLQQEVDMEIAIHESNCILWRNLH